MSRKNLSATEAATTYRYKQISLSRLGAPEGLAPDDVQALGAFVPAIVVRGDASPFTEFGLEFCIGRHPIPVIERAGFFHPIGGYRILSLARRLNRKGTVIVQVWDASVLQRQPKFAVQDALLTSLLFSLNVRSYSAQLKTWHGMLDRKSRDEIFLNAQTKNAFQTSFGVNRRGSPKRRSPTSSVFAQADLWEVEGDQE